jgi:hypothetical protein
MDSIGLVADIVTAGAALTAAIVAVKGLGTWQHQLKGQFEYELSRKILGSVFKYRDALIGVRHPSMWANEMPYPPQEKAATMSNEQIRFYGVAEAYEARWDKVKIERASLYSEIIETEAVWGTKLKELFDPIFQLEHELFVGVRHHVELINPDVRDAKKDAIEKINQKKRDILYDVSGDEPDEYNRELHDLISNVENYLKPKLQRK